MRPSRVKYYDIAVLIVVVLSTGLNYLQQVLEINLGLKPWKIAYLGVTLCLLIYAIQNVSWKRKWSIANLLLFGINFTGVAMGYNLQTKGYPETIIVLALIGIAYYLHDHRKKIKSLFKRGSYKRKGN